MLGFFITAVIIVSVIYSVPSGGEALSESVLSGCTDAVYLCINLAAAMGLWGGVMRVAQRCGITDKITRIVAKPLRLLFRGLEDKETLEAISLNVTANLLGLGNAATPLGIKAMKRLCGTPQAARRNERHTAVFVLLNTASIQLIPMTVGSMRLAHGAANPWDCTLPTILTSVASVITGTAVASLLFARKKGGR